MVIFKTGLRRYLPAETFQPLVWLGLFFAFSALPVAVVYATRSSPMFLALACLALLAHEYRVDRRLNRLWALSKGGFRKPMVLPLILMTVLGMASALWSAAPGHTLRTALQFTGSLVLGVAWVSLVSRFRRGHVLPFLAGGLTAAFLALSVELLLPPGVRGYFTDAGLSALNRGIVQLSVLAGLFAALAALSGAVVWRVWAVLVLLAAIAAAASSSSQASVAFWLAFGILAVPAAVAPRLAISACATAAAAVVALFPWLMLASRSTVPELWDSAFSGEWFGAAHAGQRLMIWTELSRIVPDRFWFGWGMESERAIDWERVVRDSPLSFSPHHPHSLALELWTGLGLAGVVAALGVLASFVRLVGRYDNSVVGWTASLFGGIVLVWLVSHGAWEHWWLALLALSLGSLLALNFYDGEANDPASARMAAVEHGQRRGYG